MFRCWKTVVAVWLAAALALSAIVHAARTPKTAPEIFSLDPSDGPAGTTVKVTGTGFERTRYVLFAAGRTGQQAKFKVVSDKELEVTAPPYLRDGTSATVVVVAANGAAVGIPPSVLEVDHRQGKNQAATFYLVRSGGDLASSQGVVLVDQGGQAEASDKSSICFVKNGGTLQHTNRFPGVVIHEPDAILQIDPNPSDSPTRLLKVPVINASPGVEPFLYQRPAAPPTRAKLRRKSLRSPLTRCRMPALSRFRGPGFRKPARYSFSPANRQRTKPRPIFRSFPTRNCMCRSRSRSQGEHNWW